MQRKQSVLPPTCISSHETPERSSRMSTFMTTMFVPNRPPQISPVSHITSLQILYPAFEQTVWDVELPCGILSHSKTHASLLLRNLVQPERESFEAESLLQLQCRSARKGAPAFKPQKATRGTSSWQLKQFADATLGSGSLRKAVKLPEGEDLDEWLAVNGKERNRTNTYEADQVAITAVVDFYNQINLLYGSITEFCSPQSCPEMKATDE